MVDVTVSLPSAVVTALEAWGRSRVGEPSVAELIRVMVLRQLQPPHDPGDLDRAVIAACRALLAGRVDEVAALLTDDASLLLGVTLRLVNTVGVAGRDGDVAAWDGDLLRMLTSG